MDIDEAEEEFSKRHTILNKYAIMANRRKNEPNEQDEDEGKEKTSAGKTSSLNDMDAWNSIVGKGKSRRKNEDENLSDEDESDTEKRKDESDDGKKKKSTKKKEPKKKKRTGGDEDDEDMQLNEESDDGDGEGLEKDYSETESEEEEEEEKAVEEKDKIEDQYEEKGIDMEEAMRAFDEDDEDSDEDEANKTIKDKNDPTKKETFKDPFNDDELSKDSITNKKTSERKLINNFKKF